MHDTEQFFNEYIQLAENICNRLGAQTSCDDDYVIERCCYPELSVGSLLWNHFCDRYISDRGSSFEHLSMQKLVDRYDEDPEYAYAYLKTFEAILDKYHVENNTPIDYRAS